MKKIKVLNLYSGIGGNRLPLEKVASKHGYEVEVTAIEYDEKIAAIYKDNFPKDEVIVTDAHDYLLEHFREFDFIWASPPCPTHSRARKSLAIKKRKDGTTYEQNKPVYPDMKLYEEILLLDGYFKGHFVIENVKPWYEPLIEAYSIGRHLFWSDINLDGLKYVNSGGHFENVAALEKIKGFDLSGYHGVDKKLLLRNCVEHEVAEMIYERVFEDE